MNPTGEIGVTTFDGTRVSSRVRDYLKAANIDLPEEAQPPYWGGAFLAWVAVRHGLTPPVDAVDPESWRDWGHPVAAPEPGTIAILTAGGGRRGFLVGVVQRTSAGKVYVIGGDLGGQVGFEAFDVGRVIECRKPHQGAVAQQPAVQPQAIHITLEQPPQVDQLVGQPVPVLQAPAPAPLIIEAPGRTAADVDLRLLVDRLRSELSDLKAAFASHEHQFLKGDGTPVKIDDIVLRSEMKVEPAA